MYKNHRRYPWPASRIDRDVMAELHRASQRTGLKITELIADAVHEAMNRALERTDKPAPIGFTASHQPQHTVA